MNLKVIQHVGGNDPKEGKELDAMRKKRNIPGTMYFIG